MNKVFERLNKVVWPLLEQFSGPLSLFILIPIVMHKHGAAYLGEWLFILTLLMIGPLIFFGVSACFSHDSTIYHASFGEEELNRISFDINFFLKLQFIYVLLMLILFFSVFYLGVEVQYPVLLGVFLIPFAELDNFVVSYYKGAGKFKVISVIEVVARSIMLVALFVCATFFSFYVFIFSFVLLLVFKSVLKFIYFIKNDFDFENFKVNSLKANFFEASVFKKSSWFFLSLLGGASFASLDRFLIVKKFGLAALANYGPCAQVAFFILSGVAAVAQLIMPWSARLIQQERFDLIIKVATLVALVFSSVPLIVYFNAFSILELWISHAFAIENHKLFEYLLLSVVLMVFLAPYYFSLLGIGRYKAVAITNFIGGLLVFFASYYVAFLSVTNVSLDAFAKTKLLLPMVQLCFLYFIIMEYCHWLKKK